MKKKFVNNDGSSNLKSFSDIRKWQQERRAKKKDLTFKVPRVGPDLELLANNKIEPTVTFIGHSTFLVQLGGLNIVTDPVWANRMGFGARLNEPGMAIDDLPDIDVVVLSHAHYDHLHLGSLRRLPGDITFLVPEGLGAWFRKKGFGRVHELAWWDEIAVGGVTFGFVPAKHWTRRTLWDTNSSHWGGWMMTYGKDRLYFAGDSGYDDIFLSIGEKYPDISVALVPIGAYEPEWFMGGSHMMPEEAIQSYQDVKGRIFIPMHYDAFHLADDTPKEALDRLQADWKRRDLPDQLLWTMDLGRTRKWSAEYI